MDEDVLEQIKHLLNDSAGPGITLTGIALMDRIGPYLSYAAVIGGVIVMIMRLYIGWNETRAWWKRNRAKKNGE